MSQLEYQKNLPLDSQQLREKFHGMGYILDYERISNNSKQDGKILTPTEIEVVKVSLECLANNDGDKEYRVVFLIESNKKYTINLSAKEYASVAGMTYAATLRKHISRLLQKDGKGLSLRKIPSTKKISFRTTEKVGKKIRENADRCKMKVSAYIARFVSGIESRQALTEKQEEYLKELIAGRRDLEFFYHMLTVWRKGKSKEEIADAVVSGERFIPLRKRIAEMLTWFDDTIVKLNEK